MIYGVRIDLATGETETLGEGTYGPFPFTWTKDHGRAVLGDGYTAGDVVLFERDGETKQMLWGTLLEDREEGVEHPLSGFGPSTSRTPSKAFSSRRRCSTTRVARAT